VKILLSRIIKKPSYRWFQAWQSHGRAQAY
jgi:hypothetical protein